MKKILGFVVGLIALLIGGGACAQPMRMDNSLLWEISGKGLSKPSYLFGTIHQICPDDYLWTDLMKRSFDKSDKICLEMDLDDEKVMAVATMGFIDKSGKKLSGYFSKEDYAALSKYMKDSMGMSILLFESMKPMVLQSIFAMKNPFCKAPVSYEEKMVTAAKKGKKEVLGLEEPKEQIDALESIPTDSVIKEIMDVVKNKSDDRALYGQMVNMYKAQDIQALQKLIMETEDYGSAINTILDARNKKWISRMAAMIGKSSVFFAVGAGHLYGEYGVISLLRQKGYRVEPLMEITRK